MADSKHLWKPRVREDGTRAQWPVLVYILGYWAALGLVYNVVMTAYCWLWIAVLKDLAEAVNHMPRSLQDWRLESYTEMFRTLANIFLSAGPIAELLLYLGLRRSVPDLNTKRMFYERMVIFGIALGFSLLLATVLMLELRRHLLGYA